MHKRILPRISYKTGFWILFAISIIGTAIIGFDAIKYKLYYEEAIKQGTENTMTAIQMTAACVSLGNFTQDQILRKTIDMFLLNKSAEKTGRGE